MDKKTATAPLEKYASPKEAKQQKTSSPETHIFAVSVDERAVEITKNEKEIYENWKQHTGGESPFGGFSIAYVYTSHFLGLGNSIEDAWRGDWERIGLGLKNAILRYQQKQQEGL